MKPAIALKDLDERTWAGQVASLARALGWRRYHTYRSERSEPGFPDEVLVRDRIVYLELKTETGRLSVAQRDWLVALTEADGEVYVVRPHDLDALAAVLTIRGGLAPSATQSRLRRHLKDTTRQELHIPAG